VNQCFTATGKMRMCDLQSGKMRTLMRKKSALYRRSCRMQYPHIYM